MENDIEQLNPMQKEAVLHKDGPMIIFAGAGTGKTRVITYRIANLLKSGVDPMKILAMTFTNKASGEMRNRVDVLAPGLGRSVWVSTFHSFAARFLRIEAASLGLTPDFLIYDENDQKNVLKDCIRELALDEKRFKPSRVSEVINRAKDDLLDAASYKIHSMALDDSYRQTIASVYELYQNKLKQSGALDFGDLLLSTVTALRENEVVRDKYQNRFSHIMVDEYQDTNHAQYLFTKYLAAKHKNICVVGDDDQSIYSWRGADIRNILEFEKDYPDCKIVKLEENYRSTKTILDSAWQVIKNNEKRIEKKVWTTQGEGSEIKFFENANAIEESQSVAGEIEAIMKNENCKLSDFAVFYRTNAQSRVLEDAFRRSGLAYVIVGSVRFYDRAEIKNMLAYLRLIHNPNDGVSFKRVINIPKRGVGKTTLDKYEQYAVQNGLTLWQALDSLPFIDITPSSKRALLGFKTMLQGFRQAKETDTVGQIILKVIEKSGYIQELEAEETPEAKSRIENIHELVSAISEFENRSPDKTLAGYLTQVALVNDIDELSDDNDRVIMMTLHLAKGLEFKNVFITGLEEGLFPIGESAYDPESLEEERRLMYVGMTRAKENLYFSWAQERTVFGKTHWNLPSRFIDEALSLGGVSVRKAHKAAMEDDGKMMVEVRSDEPSYLGSKPYSAASSASKPDNSLFPMECRVKHAQFGFGKVIDRSGSGEDLKVVVLFESGQWKKLMVKYANLERV